jgi:hypothetical protein
MTAYNLAIADWFHAPEIREIDITAWHGGIGQSIRVQAADNVQVTQVNVVITDSAGAVLEQGAATRAEGLWWIYTTTATATDGAQVLVTAQDLPGNVTNMTVVYND